MRKDVNVGDLVLLTKVSSKRLRKPVVAAVTALREDMFEVSGHDTVGVHYDMAVDEWTRVGRVPQVGDKMDVIRNHGVTYPIPKTLEVSRIDGDGDVYSTEEIDGFEIFLIEDIDDDDIIRFVGDPTPAIVARSSAEDIPDAVQEYVEELLSGKSTESSSVDITEAELGFEPKEDVVNHPSHYNAGKFETIELIEEITKNYEDGYLAYCVGNVVKYLSRAPFKHETPEQDLEKAAKYLEFALDSLSKRDAA